MNIEGARILCGELGVVDGDFYKAITSFPGASNRLELISETSNTSIYSDFAHSPSKLKATVDAVKEQFPGRQLVSCMELHTFSSLSEHFLDHYKGTLDSADIPFVYFNSHAAGLKRLPLLSVRQVKEAFGNKKLNVVTDSEILMKELTSIDWHGKNLLLMSSGNFNNLSVRDLVYNITGCGQDEQ